jgi:hypothetical protein
MSGVKPFRIRPGHVQLDSDGEEQKFIGLELDLEVGAEAANVIEANVFLVDAAGNDIARQWTGLFRLYDGDMGDPDPATEFEMDVTTGTGVTAGTKAAMLIQSNASGEATIDITDVAGASGATIYLVVQVVSGANAATAYSAITFD